MVEQEEYIKIGIKKEIIKIEKDRIYYPNNKSYDFNDPEEKVRASLFVELIENYKYPKKRLDTEVIAPRREPQLPADIVVYKDDDLDEPYIVVETKANSTDEDVKVAKREGLGNCNLLNATFLMVQCNKKRLSFNVTNKPSLKSLEKNLIADVPVSYSRTPKYRFYKAVSEKDLVTVNFRDLSYVFQRCHDIIWAGGKRDPSVAFDEMGKLMFAKLYDERNTKNREEYKFQFGTDESEETIADRVKDLYEKARKIDEGVFKEKIDLNDDKIARVVETLQHVSLINTDLDSKGRAFEQFLSEVFRGKLGQYFTRRELIEFCIKMATPNEEDIILDPACGSGGFLLYALKKVMEDIKNDYAGDEKTITRKQYDFSHYNLYGVEINDKIARVAMMDMIVHDDGHTNIEENTALDSRFKNNGIKFNHFTLILTNPPFGDSIKEGDNDKLGTNKLKNFGICGSSKPKAEKTEILFLERCHQFLKAGGRIAIVVPEGLLNNPGDKYVRVRNWIKTRFKINAIVSLPEFSFSKSGAGIRTSILFMEKKSSEDPEEDYQIFLGVAKKIGYDATGKPTENHLPKIAEAYTRNIEDKTLAILKKNLSALGDRLDPRHYDPYINEMITRIHSLDKKRGIKVYTIKDLLLADDPNNVPEVKKGKTFDENLQGEPGDIPFYEIKNLTEEGIRFGEDQEADDKYLTKSFFENKDAEDDEEKKTNQEYELKENDILVAITGATIGKSCIVKKENIPATFCGDIARIRIDPSKCDPYYVDSFLKSKFGQMQIYKWINGATNLHLSTDALEKIVIPIADNHKAQAKKISDLRNDSSSLREKMKKNKKQEGDFFESIIVSK